MQNNKLVITIKKCNFSENLEYEVLESASAKK
jgi:hypothetical protein